MITGAALIVISQCLDGHPNGAQAVLVLGIIIAAASLIRGVCQLITKAN